MAWFPALSGTQEPSSVHFFWGGGGGQQTDPPSQEMEQWEIKHFIGMA